MKRTFVSKFLKLKVLKKPAETIYTKEGVNKVIKPAEWIRFINGFYETEDPETIKILEKCPSCVPLEDTTRQVIDGQITNIVIPEETAVPFKQAVEILGGDEKVLRKLIALKRVEVIDTDKGKRYKVSDIQKFLTEAQ